ncbi:MAG: response regulator [Candidatus Obscuribacterales bacterium]|nr:response regulator [Cyanobacteria bacterium SZAS LIN-5]
MTSSEDAFLKKLRAAFVGEAHEQIEHISLGLSQLLSTTDDTERQRIVENTFRELHNMKGSARAVNLLSLEAVCQSLEDIFAQFKRSDREITAALLDTLHEVVDSLSIFLNSLETSESIEHSAALDNILETLSKLDRSEGSKAKSTDASISEDTPLPDWSDTIPTGKGEEESEQATKKKIEDESPESILDSFVFDSSWQESSTPGALFDIAETPPPATTAAPTGFNAVTAPTAALFEATSPMMASTIAESARESIRIPAARLDELLMRAEDMLSLKIMSRQHNSDLNNVGFRFDDFAREFSKIYADVRAARQMIDRDQATSEEIFIESVLTRVLEFLDSQQQQMSVLGAQLSNLQTSSLNDFRIASTTVETFLENTKKLLMMPASTMLELMPKMVRELSRELGKEVDLTINGGTIQLDKRVLSQVKDPLIHILRNSIDHGMEKPEVRLEAGKSRRGSLIISVMPEEGNTVEIVVTDDGAGINIEKIKTLAIKNGLLDTEKSKSMTDAEAIALIFQSSFSTSDTISEISGRGLGLAIAKENIEKLGGRLFVESRRGLGTSFRIKLPVTVATFRGVLIRCSDETLIVPTSDLERLIKVKREHVTISETSRIIKVEGREIPLLRLDDVLELPLSTASPSQHLVMVLRHSDSMCGFEIDEVLEEQEILVKKLSKPLVRVRNVAGVTVLGSGKPAAILNVSDLLKSARKISALKKHRQTPAAKVAGKRILIVDDTITARILMKNILESAGYLVKTANDGTEALKVLTREKFDMLLTDIEMPKMNGIELTAAVRKSGQKLPIILVTSMTDQKFRDEGTEAGADAFFVKSSFDQNNLLDVIKRLM